MTSSRQKRLQSRGVQSFITDGQIQKYMKYMNIYIWRAGPPRSLGVSCASSNNAQTTDGTEALVWTPLNWRYSFNHFTLYILFLFSTETRKSLHVSESGPDLKSQKSNAIWHTSSSMVCMVACGAQTSNYINISPSRFD